MNGWPSSSAAAPWAISTFLAGHDSAGLSEARAVRRLVKATRNFRGTDGSGATIRSSFATITRQPVLQGLLVIWVMELIWSVSNRVVFPRCLGGLLIHGKLPQEFDNFILERSLR